MTAPATEPMAPPPQLGRSILAVFLGFLFVVVSSLGTDQILHVLQVYPPWNEPMRDPGLNALALAYRTVYTIIGAYITAHFAPYATMRHVWIFGFIGLALGALGVIVGAKADLGPLWYPIALAVEAVPCAWVGGRLYVRREGGRA